MHNETQLDSKEIFSGKVISLSVDNVRLQDGNTSVREVVHHGGGAAIVALNEKGEVAMVRQYRYAHGREMLEIPAGKVEAGEAPIVTARRELEEEAACTAETLVPFGQIIPTCAYCTEVIYLFLAKGLSPSVQNLDADEFVSIEWMPLEEAAALALSGSIEDSKTAIALLKAKILQDSGKL